MKVLIATKETQGKLSDDFCFTIAGELVTYGNEHDGETIDGECGCRRSLVGLESLRATTTFKVEDRRDLSERDLEKAVERTLTAAGYTDRGSILKQIADTKQLYRAFEPIPSGTVWQRRGPEFSCRRNLTAVAGGK